MLSGKKGLGKFTLINHLMNYIFAKDDYDIKSQTINSKSIKYSQIVNGSRVLIVISPIYFVFTSPF